MINANTLTPEITAEIPDLPNPVAVRYVVLAARELCDVSPVWQRQVNITAETRVVQLAGAAADAEVVRLMPRGLRQNGVQLPVSVRPSGDRLAYYIQSRHVLMLTLAPGDTQFEAIVQLRPTADAVELDDAVLADYRETILCGALYRAYRMVNEAWANADMAQVHQQQFMAGVERSKTDVRRAPTEAAS